MKPIWELKIGPLHMRCIVMYECLGVTWYEVQHKPGLSWLKLGTNSEGNDPIELLQAVIEGTNVMREAIK